MDEPAHEKLVRYAYQEAREYVREGFPRGLRAYGSFRDYCNRAQIDHRQVLAEVRRAEWDKVWQSKTTTQS